MKLQIQTLTRQVGEVETDPKDTVLDLKVCVTEVNLRISSVICFS